MKNLKKMALVALTTIALISCDNTDDTAETIGSSLTLKFDHTIEVGETITDAADNEVTVNKLRYFVTDVTLVEEDGTEVLLSNEDAATIVDLSEATNGIFNKIVPNVTNGTYTSLKFNVGVSEENYNDDDQFEQGTLYDLALEKEEDESDMFWAWTTGYIFLKLEGTYTATTDHDHSDSEETSEEVHVHSTNLTNSTVESFVSHIGNTGSSSAEPSTRTDRVMEVEVSFHEEVNLNGSDASIHLTVDVENILDGTNSVDISTYSNLGTFSDVIPTNVENDVFLYDHQH